MFLKTLIACCLLCCACFSQAATARKTLPPLDIVLSNAEYAPYLGQFMPGYGLMTRVVSAAFKLENVKVDYVFYPNNRALQSAINGSVDGSLGWAQTPERIKDLLYSDPVMALRMVFFQRTDQPIAWQNLSDLHPYVIGATAGNTYSEAFGQLQSAKVLRVETVSDDVTNFRKLLAHRIDLFPIDAEVGAMILSQHFTPSERSQLQAQERAFWSARIHVVIWRRQAHAAELIRRFNLGLRQLQHSGEFARLLPQTRQQLDQQSPHG